MKFPVIRTVLEVIDYCWRERRLLVRFAALPFVLTLILSVAAVALGAGQTQQEVSAAIVAVGIVSVVAYLPLTVTWYRIAVFGESEAVNRPLFTLGRRELRLLGWQVILIAIFAAMGVCGALVTQLLVRLGESGSAVFTVLAVPWTAFWVIGLVLTIVRLTLVLALVSVDQPINLKIVWERTKGMSWRLTASMILVTLSAIVAGLLVRLIGFIVGTIAAMATGSEAGTVLPYFDLFGQNVMSFLSLVLTATLFGFIYKMLTARAMSEAQDHPPAPLETPSS